MIYATFDFQVLGTGDTGQTMIGECVNIGTATPIAGEAHLWSNASDRQTVNQQWLVTIAAGTTNSFKLRAKKSGDSGSSVCYGTHIPRSRRSGARRGRKTVAIGRQQEGAHKAPPFLSRTGPELLAATTDPVHRRTRRYPPPAHLHHEGKGTAVDD
jgi:hypothetical protein